jgi:hypothetical protein
VRSKIWARVRKTASLVAVARVAVLIAVPMAALAETWSEASDNDLAAAAAPPPRRVADTPWSGNVMVNDDAGIMYQAHPCITVDATGNAYAVWMDARNGGPTDWDIYYSYRPAGGSWEPNVRVNDDVGIVNQGWPYMGLDAHGNAYAVWVDRRSGFYDLDIYFAYRPADGSWSSDVRVDDDSGTARQWEPAIAVDSVGNAYAVWEDERNGISDIYFSYRPLGGSWGTNARVNDDDEAADQWHPSVAVDSGGNAYAVWADGRGEYDPADIYFSYRPAGGTWGPNERVNDDTGIVIAPSPSIAVDTEGNAYVAWGDDVGGVWSTYFAYRTHDGRWSPNEKISDDAGTGWHDDAKIAVDPYGNAYAVWRDPRNGHSDVFFAYRPTGGSWGANVRVNDDTGTGPQYDSSVAVDPQGNAYTLWRDQRAGENPIYEDIYFSFRPRQVLWLGDLVWNDADRDGLQDAGEAGVPGVAASLYGNPTCTGHPLWTETTDTSGNYLFTNVLSGTLCVEFSDIPSGWAISSQDIGADDTVDSDADPSTAQIQHIVVTADDYDLDLGLYMEEEFVPEAGTLLLLGSSLAGLVGYASLRWRKR